MERRAEKRSPRTLKDYGLHLRQFVEWLEAQECSGGIPADVAKAFVLSYRRHMQDRPRYDGRAGVLSHASLVGSQRTLRTFFGWAVDEGYAVDPRILRLRKTRLPQKDATMYTLRQLRELLSAVESPTEDIALRLLIGTGVRVSEAVGVCIVGTDGLPDLESDSLDRGYATLRERWDAGAKGLKTRRAPVTLALMRTIKRYQLRQRPLTAHPQLLITLRRHLPYTVSGFQSFMRRLERQVGYRVHAHAFRHTWATVLVQMGWSLEHLRAYIGHVDYATLHRYVRLATERDLGPLKEWAEFVPEAPVRPR